MYTVYSLYFCKGIFVNTIDENNFTSLLTMSLEITNEARRLILSRKFSQRRNFCAGIH